MSTRPQILIAEDNKADVFVIREAIEAAAVDADVVVVNDGQAATTYLDKAVRESGAMPNLMLLDLNLPKKSGEEVLKHLRGIDAGHQTRVLVVSSSDSPRDRANAQALGAISYFRKPSDYEEFLKLGPLVKNLLSHTSETGTAGRVAAKAVADEEYFRTIFETTPECIKLVAADGTLLKMNPAGLRMLGATDADAVVGDIVYRFIAPEHRDMFRRFNEEVCSGEKGSLEYDVIARDGTRRNLETHAAPLRLKDGRTVHLGVTRDVTDRRQAEIIRNRLSAIVDSSDDAIISKDLNAIITSWNKGAERLFGYKANEAIGRPVTMLIPPDRINEETEILGRLKRGERIDRLHTIRRHKDGTMIDVSLTISPVKDASGRIVGASKIVRNISEAKRADRARHLLSAIVDSSEDAIISKDLSGIITSWNKGAERLFGYSANEAIGKPVTILIPADRLDEEPQILSRIRRGERIDHFETVRRRKDGTLLDISLTISPVKDSSGAIVGASKIARDITERKRAEEEIRRANRDLEQFAFSASHDLQEPLRTVKIYSDLLATRYMSKLDGQALEFLEYVRKGTDRMEALVRDLLAYTRATKLDLSNATVDAVDVFTSTVQDLSGMIEEAGARVRAGTLPTVRMHEVHLKQLLLNLIQNAIKYRSVDRPPEVTVTAEREGEYWVFSVADNGVGVEPEYREKIFGLFKRLHTSDQYTGTGLGLAICQRIVDRYRGRIWVESEPGRGSTFRFTIPVSHF